MPSAPADPSRASAELSQVKWNEAKSEALWSIISGVAKTEIDCEHYLAFFCPSVTVTVGSVLTSFQGMSCEATLTSRFS